MSEPTDLSDDNFDAEVLQSEIPVLVEFWAPWCSPCGLIAPVVAELARKYDGKIKVTKANVDEVPQIAGSYGVRSIPTLLFFKGGQVVDDATIVGAVPEKDIVLKIDIVLA